MKFLINEIVQIRETYPIDLYPGLTGRIVDVIENKYVLKLFGANTINIEPEYLESKDFGRGAFVKLNNNGLESLPVEDRARYKDQLGIIQEAGQGDLLKVGFLNPELDYYWLSASTLQFAGENQERIELNKLGLYDIHTGIKIINIGSCPGKKAKVLYINDSNVTVEFESETPAYPKVSSFSLFAIGREFAQIIYQANEKKDCTICEVELENKVFMYNYNFYCKECFDRCCCKCYNCDKYIVMNSGRKVEGNSYCEECFFSIFFICPGCNESRRQSDGIYSQLSDRRYCEDCYEESYQCCERCERECYRDETYWDESEEINLCEYCYNRNLAVIKRYDYIPLFIFNKLQYENTLFMGVELEVETRQPKEVAQELKNFLKKNRIDELFYFKEDSSISGFEIVTQPMTLKYAHKNAKWNEILKLLRQKKCQSYKAETCGLHIHLDKRFFDSDSMEIYKMKMLFNYCYPWLKKFSLRNNCHYCQRENYQFYHYKNKDRGSRDKYLALNCNTTKGTHEIRLFRGNLHEKRFLAYLQFADAISYFIKDYSFMNFRQKENSTEFNINDKIGFKVWQDFRSWVEKENRYGHLNIYLNNIKNLKIEQEGV